MSYDSMRMMPDDERTVTGPFTGSPQNLGTALTKNPVIVVFDNQSTVSVLVSFKGKNWKTFQAGTGLVIDCRANKGSATDFTADIGTQFTVTGTGGTGQFSLAILNAE